MSQNRIPGSLFASPSMVENAAGRANFSSGPGDNDSVEVRRRRQGASSGPSSGQRAEAPARRRAGDSNQPPGGGGGGGGGLGPSTGGGGPATKMPIWLVVLLILGYGIYSLFFSGGQNAATVPSGAGTEAAGQPQVNNAPPDNQAASLPTATRQPLARTPLARTTATSRPAAAGGKGQTWTVMLYQDADDQILEQDISLDLNEVERIGSTDRVNIVAQIDRYKGAYTGDGNWTGTRRYYVQKDEDLQRINSKLVDDLGEVNMADGATLVDFATWAMQTYPADRYALILSDHGMGWPGGWSDADPAIKSRGTAPIISALDDNLYLMELDGALKTIQDQTGVQKLDVIGMDACLMGHLEVFSALEPYARYAVASQETEPALGWAYTGFLGGLVQNPDMDGAELSQLVVQSYIEDDQRIVDDQARADFLRQGSPMGGLFGSSQVSAGQLARQLGRDVTLTAVDLGSIPALMQSVNDLSLALQDEDQSKVASARDYAQSYTNIFGKDSHAPYIDLGSFMEMLKREGANQKVAQAADQVLAAEQQAVVAEKHGAGKPGATGVSLYFPNSTLYSSPIAGAQSYTAVAQRFAQESLWDDFLAYTYNDQAIDPASRQGVVPGGQGRAPGAGQIEISAITASSKTASPGKPVKLSAQINGKNIGYIYLFVGFYDQASNSIFVADYDFLESPDSRQISGVYYPVWKENGPFTMTLSWDPTVFQITDGKTSEVTALTPQNYGAAAEDAVYTVDGTYTYVKDRQSRHARLYFRNGKLEHVFGFAGTGAGAAAPEENPGSPREITTQAGDTFTIQEKWLDLDSSGQVAQTAAQDGKTLTFGAQPLRWEEIYAAQGEYVVGFIVEDLEGNSRQAYTRITVR